MSLLTREDTAVVVIDLQEKLIPVMHDKERLEDRAVRFLKGIRALDIPVVITQQYTKGIGKTISSVAEALGEFKHIEKNSFSCMANEEFAAAIKALNKKNVVVCGTEAHICVQQTVLQLMEAGYNAYLVADCVGSRSEEDKFWGITRMGNSGAVITTYEAVLYELLRDSKAPGFKEISAIVK